MCKLGLGSMPFPCTKYTVMGRWHLQQLSDTICFSRYFREFAYIWSPSYNPFETHHFFWTVHPIGFRSNPLDYFLGPCPSTSHPSGRTTLRWPGVPRSFYPGKTIVAVTEHSGKRTDGRRCSGMVSACFSNTMQILESCKTFALIMMPSIHIYYDLFYKHASCLPIQRVSADWNAPQPADYCKSWLHHIIHQSPSYVL